MNKLILLLIIFSSMAFCLPLSKGFYKAQANSFIFSCGFVKIFNGDTDYYLNSAYICDVYKSNNDYYAKLFDGPKYEIPKETYDLLLNGCSK